MSSEVAQSGGIPPQIVLILVGLIGSGKSTFAEALQTYFPNFRRCNQDELGDRRAVEQLARSSLRDGMSICIDRTNFDASQRSHWISIARQAPGSSVPVWVLWFDTPYNICVDRIQARLNHPTIKDAETGIQVLKRFSSQFRPPVPHEGHERLLRLTPTDHPSANYTHEEILAILERVRNSPPIDTTAALNQASLPHFFPGRGGRGRGYSGDRGRYNGRRGFSSGFQRGRGQYGRATQDSSSSWRSDSQRSSSAEQRSFGRGSQGGDILSPGGNDPANDAAIHAGFPDTRGRGHFGSHRYDRPGSSVHITDQGDGTTPSVPESSGMKGDGSATDPFSVE